MLLLLEYLRLWQRWCDWMATGAQRIFDGSLRNKTDLVKIGTFTRKEDDPCAWLFGGVGV